MDNKIDIKSLTLEELNEEMQKLNEKKFRASQIYGWLHKQKVTSFSEMKNLSNGLRQKLTEQFYVNNINKVDERVSEADETVKYLFSMRDGQVIETVLMSYKHGNSVCISSQVGCRMGCTFCASTIGGLTRHLSPSEMLDQIYYIERSTGMVVSNIVIMGTGEPFDNYENLIKFIKIINSKEGRNIGQRSITVSTCGLVDKIKDFADRGLQVNLAISLHSTTHEQRMSIMPVERKYNIDELLDSCRYYIKKTNRRITFEYALIHGVNDTVEEAGRLAKLLKGLLCHVNLIPVNKVAENQYQKSFDKDVRVFRDTLIKKGINTTIRRSLGEDIMAACGQLRKSYIDNESNEGE